DWLGREKVARIRKHLLWALETGNTTMGANVLLDAFEAQGEGGEYLARAAHRASDRGSAARALTMVAGQRNTTAAAEAVVALARIDERHAELEQRLDSADYYVRLNAALAAAYLDERALVDRLRIMQREAGPAMERLMLAAALAILGVE